LVGYAAPEGSGKVREKRLAAAAAVRRAADQEQTAISELRQALAAEGEEAPVTSAEEGPAIGSSGTETDTDLNTSAGRVKREGGKVWLESLRSRPAWITHMACLRGCLEYLGNDASSGWAYGGTGFAFALNIHEAICPSGPTAWPEQMCDALAANIGAVVEPVSAHKSEGDFAATQEEAWRKVREAIDAGHPCFGWELDVPEWYVIHGYDDQGNILFRDFGGEEREVHHTKLGDTGIGVAAIMVVKPGPAADDRAIVRDALAFAVEHGTGRHSHELYRTGLLGYDAWIAALENEELCNTDDTIGFGQGYNGKCWSECRRQAVDFLQEAKKRLDDAKLAPLFDEAIKQYTSVSESLSQLSRIFPFDAGQQAAMAEQIKDPERRRQAVTALKTARDAEATGIEGLKKIVQTLSVEMEGEK